MKQQQVNEISHRRLFRMDKNYMSTVRGSGAWYPETLKLFPETLFSSDNNNLKWAILGT